MQAKSYELQQFHKRFFIYGGIAYLVYVVFAALVLWLRGWQLWVTLLLGCLLLGSAYVAGRRSIGTMSRELRAIVDIMNQILEAPEQVPAEPYKQGELGELYTNLYKLVQALKESNRKEQEEKIFLRDIMSDISHQLKTPLASLRMSHELVAENRVTGEEQREFLEQESQELTKLEQLLNELVNLSRLETHMIQIHSLHESLKKTLTEAVSQIYMKARGKDISIQVEMDDDIVVNHDSKWTVEALTNILENAVKYSPEHTTITVRTQELASNVLIEVEDEGMGIPAEELHKIYQRFYRGRKAKEQVKDGAGVGLYLARKIIEEQGGGQ